MSDCRQHEHDELAEAQLRIRELRAELTQKEEENALLRHSNELLSGATDGLAMQDARVGELEAENTRQTVELAEVRAKLSEAEGYVWLKQEDHVRLLDALRENTPLQEGRHRVEVLLSEWEHKANADLGTHGSGQHFGCQCATCHAARVRLGYALAVRKALGTVPAVTGTTSDNGTFRQLEPVLIAHAFKAAPFYPDVCDVRVTEGSESRRRQCARPRREHGAA